MLKVTVTKKLSVLFIATLLTTLGMSLGPPTVYAATITVNSTADTMANDGQCTLREAIAAANTDTPSGGTAGECVAGLGDDVIDLTGISGTIDLTAPLPDVASNIVFNGPGMDNLTVRRDSGGNYRIFTVGMTATVTISGLTIRNGLVYDDHGGGIYNAGTLTLNNSAVIGSSAYLGGGIYNIGGLTLNDSTIGGNDAYQGGGIDNDWSGTVKLIHSTVSSNQAIWGGGGVANTSGRVTLSDSTVSTNTADYGGGLFNSGVVTLTHSAVSGNDANSDGGGISNSNAGLMVLGDSDIDDNDANSRGGGIYNDPNSQMELTGGTVNNNEASAGGGGIYNAGTLTLSDSTVSDNGTNTSVVLGGHGGGVYNSGTLTLDHTTVSTNTINTTTNDSYGGGIYNAAILTLTYSTVSNNTTSGTHCHGGGIHNEGTLTLSYSIVSDNDADGDGSGIRNVGSGSNVTLNNSTVSGNRSTGGGSGGGIWNSDGASMRLTDSTVSGNTSSNNGGGVNNTRNSTLTLNNSTIGDNNASGSGGGIWNDIGSTVRFKNSIVAGNSASAGPDCRNTATFISGDYNLLGNPTDCPFPSQPHDQVNVDPLIGPLQDNGGPTETQALRKGSPAFDAIPIDYCTDHQGTPIATDQRGISRPQGAACDIGAYEEDRVVDLSVGKVVDKVNPNVGESIAFTIWVTNSASLDATNVVVSDPLPLGLTLVSSKTNQGSYISGTGEWNVGRMSLGQSAALIITATVDVGTAGTTIINTAVITAADQVDPDPSNNVAAVAVTVVSSAVAFHSAIIDVDESIGAVIMPVSLNTASGVTVTVGYATSGGTATAGDDYVAISDTLTFGPGEITRTFTVFVTDDALDEPNETITLTLSNPTNATLGAPHATILTILDDDDQPIAGLIAVNDGPTMLGQVTTLTATITAGSNVTYTWAFGDSTASGAVVTHTYQATGDYTAVVTASNSASIVTATTTVIVSAQAPPERYLYLPLIVRNLAPPVTFPVHIGDAIPARPVAYQGEVFYTTSVHIPDELPLGGHFYFSSQSDASTEVVVDDELAVLLDGIEVLTYDFSTSGSPKAAIVEVPWTTMEELAGQTITIEYRDVYGVIVQATEMWLIWIP